MHTAPDIADCIRQTLIHHFRDLNGETPRGVYETAPLPVEKPLLAHIMDECGGNQSRAAEMLGLNRNTLRKKLLQHKLLD